MEMITEKVRFLVGRNMDIFDLTSNGVLCATARENRCYTHGHHLHRFQTPSALVYVYTCAILQSTVYFL